MNRGIAFRFDRPAGIALVPRKAASGYVPGRTIQQMNCPCVIACRIPDKHTVSEITPGFATPKPDRAGGGGCRVTREVTVRRKDAAGVKRAYGATSPGFVLRKQAVFHSQQGIAAGANRAATHTVRQVANQSAPPQR